MKDFENKFAALTGNEPFPWQRALYERFLKGEIPSSCNIPTGLGKTSVIAIWLLARGAGALVPTRLVYVVNRRTVVDQTSVEVMRLRENLREAGIEEDLAVSTLRGQMADNRAWSADPSQPAVVCGTVDMIGSRLLFSGYRIGFKSRPLHAGFLGQDALLVHDEAHLEPAFQCLLKQIEREQKRMGDLRPLRVMELTATSRSDEPAFGLGGEDNTHPVVARRVHAKKKLVLHTVDDRNLVDSVVERALRFRDSNSAVLVFLRTVDDVMAVISRLRKAKVVVQQLTGTMRGFERDRLVTHDPVMARFLPGTGAAPAQEGTVYLVCTSAGEVGVNLSADHLVCDLSTFDSMAQRFGRVNRFGRREDTEIHVLCPKRETLDSKDPLDGSRLRTLELLDTLDGDASPAALSALDPRARAEAFAPEPKIFEANDILFDAWAMTTIREPLPGRPAVAAYLHGAAEWESPQTHVAWRDEVALITSDDLLERYPPEELLEDYPLKPHEILTDRTARVVDTLVKLAAQYETPDAVPLWVVREDGGVDPRWSLGRLARADRQRLLQELSDCTLLLSPRHCRPVDGMLTTESAGGDTTSASGADVADLWRGEGDQPMRQRVFDGAPPPPGMRLVRRIRLRDEDIDESGASDETREDTTARGPSLWCWYEVPRGDTEGSRTAAAPVLLEVHSNDVEREATRIVSRLPFLTPGIRRAVISAAKLHDIGKARRLWQRSVGNTDPERPLAKSKRLLDVTGYRHELGSVIDAERNRLLAELEPEERELALHLIAAHHGRARPHFPTSELFDPEARDANMDELSLRVANRFASLQRRFGRWGLAYLESLVRAADYAASANPSAVVEV